MKSKTKLKKVEKNENDTFVCENCERELESVMEFETTGYCMNCVEGEKW
jgi:ribosomal protein L37AE/L43A